MGNIFSCCSWCSNRSLLKVYNVLLLGLSGSGKTEIGTKLNGKERKDFSSTNGVRGFKKFIGNDLINLTEIGGNDEMRKIWHHYYVKTMGIIFTIDISDYESISFALNCLNHILQHKYISGKPILILATKVDKTTNEIDIFDLNEYFYDLEKIANRFQSHMLLLTIGLNDLNELNEGIVWLKDRMDGDYQKIQNRIIFDKEDAARENFPIYRHHGDRKLIRSARLTFRKVGNIFQQPGQQRQQQHEQEQYQNHHQQRRPQSAPTSSSSYNNRHQHAHDTSAKSFIKTQPYRVKSTQVHPLGSEIIHFNTNGKIPS